MTQQHRPTTPAWYRRECAEHDRALVEPMQGCTRFAGDGMTKAERNELLRRSQDTMRATRP